MLEYISDGGSGGGDRTPILKFSAKDGSFIAVERVQIDGQWTNQDNELTPPIKVATVSYTHLTLPTILLV